MILNVNTETNRIEISGLSEEWTSKDCLSAALQLYYAAWSLDHPDLEGAGNERQAMENMANYVLRKAALKARMDPVGR